ncbi:hypothetical protein EIP91_009936, partial [Steccherinum ochraceum]
SAPPTSTPVPPNTLPTAPSDGGIKRGLSYNEAPFTKLFTSSQIGWAYNWGSQTGGDLPAGIDYFPMLWSNKPEHTGSWVDDATAAIAAGASHLLGFNEPDLGSQANMSPQEAADAWKTYIEPFAGKAKLVSPAITNGGAPMGTAWLDDFLAACTECTIDAIAIHIYDSATNVGYFQNYITDVGTKYGKPVLVTEFGASGQPGQQQDFLTQMLPFLDGLASVSHYAYFMDGPGVLANADGTISDLGITYGTTN